MVSTFMRRFAAHRVTGLPIRTPKSLDLIRVAHDSIGSLYKLKEHPNPHLHGYIVRWLQNA